MNGNCLECQQFYFAKDIQIFTFYLLMVRFGFILFFFSFLFDFFLLLLFSIQRIDDIEDNSCLRRGVPVAHSIYGVASTINAANYVFFLALEKVQQLGHPDVGSFSYRYAENTIEKSIDSFTLLSETFAGNQSVY